jgi:hypothetical protein
MGMRLVEASYYLVEDGWHKLGALKQGSFFLCLSSWLGFWNAGAF